MDCLSRPARTFEAMAMIVPGDMAKEAA